MAKNLFLSFLLGAICSLNLASQNLIQGGDMESAASWSQHGGITAGATNSQLTWGDLPDPADNPRPQGYKPAGFGTGGFLTVCEDWGIVQYFIAQPVTLTANTTYTATFDYNIGEHSISWLQVYLGKADPAADTDYRDNQIGNVYPWDW